MTRFLGGMVAVSLLLIAWHVKLRHVVYDQFNNGNDIDWGDVCKRPTLEQMTGRLGNE